MIIINAEQLGILCASHFISGFDYASLPRKCYHTNFDIRLQNIDFEIDYSFYFVDNGRVIEKLKMDIEPKYIDEAIDLTGDAQEAKKSAVELVNNYLEGYYVKRITND